MRKRISKDLALLDELDSGDESEDFDQNGGIRYYTYVCWYDRFGRRCAWIRTHPDCNSVSWC